MTFVLPVIYRTHFLEDKRQILQHPCSHVCIGQGSAACCISQQIFSRRSFRSSGLTQSPSPELMNEGWGLWSLGGQLFPDVWGNDEWQGHSVEHHFASRTSQIQVLKVISKAEQNLYLRPWKDGPRAPGPLPSLVTPPASKIASFQSVTEAGQVGVSPLCCFLPQCTQLPWRYLWQVQHYATWARCL